MRQYVVTGMSCAACQARVEKAVSRLEGVTSCSVSLLTGSMGVEGTVSDERVIAAVEAAGYGATVKNEKNISGLEEAEFPANGEIKVLKRRLVTGAFFLLILMYLSMGHNMFGWPLPVFLDDNSVLQGILQMFLAVIVMFINGRFFISGTRSLLKGAPNMDTLVALGSSASFFWSVFVLIQMILQKSGGQEVRIYGTEGLYFESAAMILVLITVGKLLEAKSRGRTTDALKSLIKLAPRTAVVERDGREVTVSLDELKENDIYLVRPGQSIPADGVVVEGNSSVDESALTGESIPVDKAQGEKVYTATINRSGFIRCRAEKVGKDTALAQIIKMVSDAAATKAPIAKLADKVSGVFVPTVMGISLITLIIWLVSGNSFETALTRAVAVLVISCPCALGLATPVAIMVGNGVGARNGILFKTATALEETGKAEIVILDKTGTVTKGEPSVMEVIPTKGTEIGELLVTALSLEIRSEHPLAKAIVREAENRGIIPESVEAFREISGNGLTAVLKGERVFGGSEKFIRLQAAGVNPDIERLGDREQAVTKTFFVRGGKLLGMITIADAVKEDSKEAIAELKSQGTEIILLTGDNKETAMKVAAEAGIEHVAAEVLPAGKELIVRRMKELGRTIMVGDGINDAPALASADIGIAIGAGTDVAIDAAEVVLMNSSLKDVSAAIGLSRATIRNIKGNLFWAFFYNVIGIPLAAGAFYGILGWQLSPMFGAAAMSLSSFFVVTNALRLNGYRMHKKNLCTDKAGSSRDEAEMSNNAATNNKAGSSCDEAGMSNDAVPNNKAGSGRDEAELSNNAATNDKAGNGLSEAIEKILCELEEKTMTKTMKIEGMMCVHCEARVKKVLEAIAGVESAEVSHTAGTAILTLSTDVENDVLKKAVEDQDYKVLEIF